MTPQKTQFVPVLALNQTHEGLTITSIHPDGADHVGTFTNIADAWAAVDALDSAANPS